MQPTKPILAGKIAQHRNAEHMGATRAGILPSASLPPGDDEAQKNSRQYNTDGDIGRTQ